MIAVVGLGFVGLTTALGFAHKGHKVYGFDNDPKRRKELKEGTVPFYEPSLGKYLNKYKDSRFFISGSLKEAVSKADVVFFCVGTPSMPDGKADIRFLKDAVKDSLRYIELGRYKTLVIKSTVPPSTAKEAIKPLMEKAGFDVGKEVGLANNPEFLREGFAWEDFINPDRVVIGENDRRSGGVVEGIYKAFGAPIYRVSLNTAEFIKYLSNTLLSALISFSNEMSMAAHKIGDIDIPGAFKILHADRRWYGNPAGMTSYVYPGCGFGGYCLPKDTRAIYVISKSKGHEPTLIKEVLSVNEKIKRHIVDEIVKSAAKGDSVGILGLSFKPESDDVRDTPSKYIIEALLKKGYKVIAYDPLAMENFRKEYRLPIKYAASLEDVAKKSGVIVLLTAWNEFKLKKDMLRGKKIIDGRYFLA